MLEVNGITKSFGGLTAVAEASLTVREGSITALIGPNGAGKTTLFGIIAGFIPADRGAIWFAGKATLGLPTHAIAHLGLVRTFQIVQPFAGLSVRENIAVGCQLRERSRAKALDDAATVAGRVGMSALIDQPAGGLTIAGRKRLELARALATQPRLLLLDEVMAGLNPSEIAELVPLIRAIRDSGVTLLLTEHVMQAVMGLAEQVYVLNNGRIIADGPPAAIVARGLIQVPEGRRIFPNLSVRENLEIGSYRRGRPRRAANLERVATIFPRLSERMKQLAGTLSGGEQQMLAIGRGLMAEPLLLILDEPSLGLSPLLVEEMFALVARIRDEGLSVLLVEQNVMQSLAIADRVYVLEQGQFTLSGAGAALLDDPRLRQAYLGL